MFSSADRHATQQLLEIRVQSRVLYYWWYRNVVISISISTARIRTQCVTISSTYLTAHHWPLTTSLQYLILKLLSRFSCSSATAVIALIVHSPLVCSSSSSILSSIFVWVYCTFVYSPVAYTHRRRRRSPDGVVLSLYCVHIPPASCGLPSSCSGSSTKCQ